MDQAAKACPLDCDAITYDHSYSYSNFPTRSWYDERQVYDRAYFKRLFGIADNDDDNNKTMPSYESIKSSFASIYVVFHHIVTEEISERPAMEFVDLLSNIGGTMGLFIGPSLLTLTEVFELVFIYTAICWNRRKQQRRNLDSNNHIKMKQKTSTVWNKSIVGVRIDSFLTNI